MNSTNVRLAAMSLLLVALSLVAVFPYCVAQDSPDFNFISANSDGNRAAEYFHQLAAQAKDRKLLILEQPEWIDASVSELFNMSSDVAIVQTDICHGLVPTATHEIRTMCRATILHSYKKSSFAKQIWFSHRGGTLFFKDGALAVSMLPGMLEVRKGERYLLFLSTGTTKGNTGLLTYHVTNDGAGAFHISNDFIEPLRTQGMMYRIYNQKKISDIVLQFPDRR